MKKRTKKKLARFAGKSVLFLLKLVSVYPIKGIWYVSKLGYSEIKDFKVKRKQAKLLAKENILTGKTDDDTNRTETKNKLEQDTKHIEKIRPHVEPQHNSLVELKNRQGQLTSFENKLLTNKSMIGLILGARGTGKSAIGMRLLENFKAQTDKNIYALGFKAATLPQWIKVIQGIEEIENNSVLLIDEGGIEFNSRNSMSDGNKLLSEILLIARHKDLSVMFITQNCLPSNTKIKTPNGVKTLNELKKEDVIWSYDFKEEKIVSAIARKSGKTKQKIAKIYLEDGTILECSPEHRWPVFGQDGLTHKTTKDLNINKDYLIYVSGKKDL